MALKPLEPVSKVHVNEQRLEQAKQNIQKVTEERAKKKAALTSLMTAKDNGGETGIITLDMLLDESLAPQFKLMSKKAVEATEEIYPRLSDAGKAEVLSKARMSRDENYPKIRADIMQEVSKFILGDVKWRNSVPQQNLFIDLIVDNLCGVGPIEPIWRDTTVSDIMVNAPDKIYINRYGKNWRVPGCFFASTKQILEVAQQIVAPLNRKIDSKNPIVDARLPDLSRVNIVHQDLSASGTIITIRRKSKERWTMKKLMDTGSFNKEMFREICQIVSSGMTALIVGGTGSGKLLEKETELPTPDGFRKAGDVMPGDVLFDNYGNRTLVLNKYSPEEKDFYRITFKNGQTVDAGAGHLWQVSLLNEKYKYGRRPTILLVDEGQVEATMALLEKHRGTGYKGTADYFFKSVGIPNNKQHALRALVYKLVRAGASVEIVCDSVLEEHYDRIRRNQELDSRTYEQRRPVKVMTTQEMVDYGVRNHKERLNFAIDYISNPVDYSEQELPIDPYVFGAWLGDGMSKEGIICGVDKEIPSHIESIYDLTRNRDDSKGNRVQYWKFQELHSLLKENNLINNKHVPYIYRISSRQQRMEFIAGLVDTDGHVNKNIGRIELDMTSEQIVRSAWDIVMSLGWHANPIATRQGYYRNEEGNRVKCSTVYRLSFTPTEMLPLQVSRKRDALEDWFNQHPKQQIRKRRHYIEKIERIEGNPEDYFCFEVDSPDHLFLCTESYIPTHNTSFLNAVCSLIPDDRRIISIEDNLELDLPKSCHWVAEETRVGFGDTKSIGMADLVTAALRQKPDYILPGEIRTGDVLVPSLSAAVTGHSLLSSLHSDNKKTVVNRMSQMVGETGQMGSEAAGLQFIASAIDVMIIVQNFPEDGSRKVQGIYEVPDDPEYKDGLYNLNLIPLWEWVTEKVEDDGKGHRKIIGHHEKMNNISEGLKMKYRVFNEPDTYENYLKLSERP